MKLLGVGSNAKTIKSDEGGEYLTAILYLAPHTEAGGNTVCPAATSGCIEGCLYSSGRGRMSNVQQSRIKKTQWYNNDLIGFLTQLDKELKAFQSKCEKLKVKPAVRLNGTSDIRWEKNLNMGTYDIQFYDYTKRHPSRLNTLPKNYHLTYSRKETDDDARFKLAMAHMNVAVVFDELPKTYLGYPVVDGDKTDLRFLDPKGCVVGLLAKGDAKKDTSGFVIRS